MTQHNGTQSQAYTESFTQYNRRLTREVKVGDLIIGGQHPIRIQSMTTTDTMDTEASVAQIIRMVNAGCELVRLTAPSINEAQNLAVIKQELKARGIHVPLVADIHFTPNAAEAAARIVEKVRINPGNYADKKKFQQLDYSDAEYQEELDRIREKFLPLVAICKEYGTAMRIGTNHGSLSDRIMSRYGDSPYGMVESAMEFLRICEDAGYKNIVLSMKSSNPQVMIEAYRLLVVTMNKEGMNYPLHLGVTEAGDGMEGRIKSALGIGALLEDGIGDTIRVSLTEDPEFELPVARKLVDRYTQRHLSNGSIPFGLTNEAWLSQWDPFAFSKRSSIPTHILGGNQVPKVVADFSQAPPSIQDMDAVGYHYDPLTDKWYTDDTGCDLILLGHHISSFMLPAGLKALVDAAVWTAIPDKSAYFPLFDTESFIHRNAESATLNILRVTTLELSDELINMLMPLTGKWALLLRAASESRVTDLNNAFIRLKIAGCQVPVIIERECTESDTEQLLMYPATDCGSSFINGFGDGLFLSGKPTDRSVRNATAFAILQAARARITKTEYISCPSCGRTLFDLQETTALIRRQTDHLKGVKIAIMGCIVNGPGEMADADYGYVGSGPGKITLYRGKDVIKKGINKETAVDELIGIIKMDGKWNDRSN